MRGVPGGIFGILAVDKTYVKALPCPCNMFSTPTGQTEYSDGDYELGFKFKATSMVI